MLKQTKRLLFVNHSKTFLVGLVVMIQLKVVQNKRHMDIKMVEISNSQSLEHMTSLFTKMVSMLQNMKQIEFALVLLAVYIKEIHYIPLKTVHHKTLLLGQNLLLEHMKLLDIISSDSIQTYLAQLHLMMEQNLIMTQPYMRNSLKPDITQLVVLANGRL